MPRLLGLESGIVFLQTLTLDQSLLPLPLQFAGHQPGSPGQPHHAVVGPDPFHIRPVPDAASNADEGARGRVPPVGGTQTQHQGRRLDCLEHQRFDQPVNTVARGARASWPPIRSESHAYRGFADARALRAAIGLPHRPQRTIPFRMSARGPRSSSIPVHDRWSQDGGRSARTVPTRCTPALCP
jgi:hypothetical protein